MLSRSIIKSNRPLFMGMNSIRMFSANKQYDLVVIGGGPGGK